MRFNELILLDIIYIEGKLILHIVDVGTRLSAARFLPDISRKTIWKTIFECWAMIYTGLPNRILTDQGSAFSSLFISMSPVSVIKVERTGIKEHQASD